MNKPIVTIVGLDLRRRGGVASVLQALNRPEYYTKYHIRFHATTMGRRFVFRWFSVPICFVKFLFLRPGADLVHVHLSYWMWLDEGSVTALTLVPHSGLVAL